MKAQSSSAIATAHMLIGAENVLRIRPGTMTENFTLDGVRRTPELEALGRAEAERLLQDVAAMFFRGPARPFVPDHCLDDDAQLALPLPVGTAAA